MKPTPQQLIDGVRNRLRNAIAPEVTSAHGQAEVRRVMAVLRDLDWNEAAFILMRETGTLAQILADADAWLSSDPARARALGFSQTTLLSAMTPPQTFAEAYAQHAACLAALAGLIGTLSRASSSSARPYEAEISRLRADIALRLGELHARQR